VTTVTVDPHYLVFLFPRRTQTNVSLKPTGQKNVSLRFYNLHPMLIFLS
jgi:hypothetical protein